MFNEIHVNINVLISATLTLWRASTKKTQVGETESTNDSLSPLN